MILFGRTDVADNMNYIESRREGIDWRLVTLTRLPVREPARWQLRWVKAEQNFNNISFNSHNGIVPTPILVKCLCV